MKQKISKRNKRLKLQIALATLSKNDFAKNFSDVESRYSQIGSYERIDAILRKIPQIKENKVIYLFAGSWAIEFTSGQKLEHDDIDIIFLGNPSWYIDDAITKEEHCCNVIPLPDEYLLDPMNILETKNTRGVGKVFVPSLTLQYCFKLIGELNPVFSERAIQQASLLIKQYNSKLSKDDFIKECSLILKNCLPNGFDSILVSKMMFEAIVAYKNWGIKNCEMKLVEAHSIINHSLKKKFKDMGLE